MKVSSTVEIVNGVAYKITTAYCECCGNIISQYEEPCPQYVQDKIQAYLERVKENPELGIFEF